MIENDKRWGRRMKKKIQCVDLVLLCLIVLTLANIFFLVFRVMRGEFTFGDFRGRWQESAYLLRGINPFDAVTGKVTIDEIGVIDPDFATVPWAWIWGMIISPGFFKYEIAQAYGYFIFFVGAVLTALVVYKYIEKNFPWTAMQNGREKEKWCICAFFIVLSQYCWVWSFLCGNHGALACCFIIVAVCVYRDHPYFAGIMMTFAMIKPQVAAVFFVTFLILKQYRVIITAVIAETLTMVVLWMMTGVEIWKLCFQTVTIGTSYDTAFYGLFNMLKYVGVSTTWILLLDIAVGIIYLVVHTLMTRRYVGENDLHIFIGATIASTFWFYKQSHDYVILIIPCIVLLKEIYEHRERDYFGNLFMLLIYIVIFYIQSFTRKVVCRVFPMISESFGKGLFMNLTCIVLLIMGMIWLRRLKKLYKDEGDQL